MLPSKLQGGLMSEYRIPPSARRSELRDGHPARFEQPLIQALDARPHVNLRRPAGGRLESPRVGDVIALVARTPFLHPDVGFRAVQRSDHLEQLEQADR